MTAWRCLHAGRGLVASLAAWLLVGCVGCTGVPILVPDLAQASTPVQLGGRTVRCPRRKARRSLTAWPPRERNPASSNGTWRSKMRWPAVR